MKWATGLLIHLDGAACAWVIRRVIDPHAEFVFVVAGDEVPDDAIPFDMPGVELGRRPGPTGDECAFEAVLRHYDLPDPTLWRIAEIVHDAELCDERYHASEARGLRAVVDGLALVGDDADTLAITKPMFDGLYRNFYYDEILGVPRNRAF
jgi:hypothetical protein